jgi:F-box-like
MMSMNQSKDAITRSVLSRTINTVKGLASTLDDLLADEKATLSRLEQLKLMVKEEERKSEDLKDLIGATRISKGTMETVVHTLRSLLSPMKTLPTEVLIRIFSETIEQANQERQLMAFKCEWPYPDRTAILLAQVCTRWRQIFSLNQHLWNHIDLPHGSTWQWLGEIQQFNHYTKLGSSTQQLLSVPGWDMTIQEAVLGALGGCSTRYKSIELSTADDPVGLWDVQALNAQEVTLYRGYECQTSSHFTPLFHSASKLTIYGNAPRWGTIPWASLQTLIIRQFFCEDGELLMGIMFTRDDFIQLLNATPSLLRLEFDFQMTEILIEWEDDIHMLHSRIKHLSVHLNHFAGGKGLFGLQLNLPALCTLEFLSIHCHFAPVNEGESIYIGLNPSRLVLPALKVYETVLASHLLHVLPSIQHLDLLGPNSKPLLQPLHPGDPSAKSIPIPKLEALCITDSDIDGETLLRFVKARLQLRGIENTGISVLKSIQIHHTPGVTVADWNNIQAMLEEGRGVSAVQSTAAE